MNSIWSKDFDLPIFDELKKTEIKTDVLIIGGGLAGILCAYKLQKQNVNYILVEADRIFSGVSANTTAKITSQHGLIYNKLIKEFGLTKTSLYLKANQDALNEYRNLTASIDCDFEEKDNYVYSLESLKKIEKELRALEKISYKAEFAKHLPIPISVMGAVKFKNQAQFNPMKFAKEIVKGLNIYEQTAVREYDGRCFLTDFGKIRAEKAIITTHFPFINKHGNYFIKMYQHRSYVLALKNATDVKGMFVDEKDDGLSFRNHKDTLLLGGGGHRTGKNGGSYGELEDFSKKHYPNSYEVTRWATQDCMTLDGVAYIGKYSKNTPNLFVATGFNKWGITSSMVAANILSDLVLEKQNPYAELYCPSRSILRPQLLLNSFETVTNLLTPTAPRCPHLGCALKWNSQEHSWDCSCHGSRFSKDGKLLDNPATDDLKQ
ncbi:MAG: FAD-dependent oxidoreductase [Ruminococcaceae bacterium]|nr:FAD-dependent oxidoreductase [Oscillospiraceae bacterium]